MSTCPTKRTLWFWSRVRTHRARPPYCNQSVAAVLHHPARPLLGQRCQRERRFKSNPHVRTFSIQPSAPVPAPPSNSVRFHNAASHAEGTDWRLSCFSACSAMEGFSLQSQRGILSPTIELLDASESGLFFFCWPADRQAHGKAVFLPQTPKIHTNS